MPFLTKAQRVFLPLPRKAFGSATGLGLIELGTYYLGLDDAFANIYSRRYTSHTSYRGFGSIWIGTYYFGSQPNFPGVPFKKNWRSGIRHIRHKFYRPTNPQTTLQQSWRSVFQTGVASWQGLTTLEKEEYNNRAKGQKMAGYHLYLREWLIAHQ